MTSDVRPESVKKGPFGRPLKSAAPLVLEPEPSTPKTGRTMWGDVKFHKVIVHQVPGELGAVVCFPAGKRFEFRRDREIIIPDDVLESIRGSVVTGEVWQRDENNVPYLKKYTINRFPMSYMGLASEDDYLGQFKKN